MKIGKPVTLKSPSASIVWVLLVILIPILMISTVSVVTKEVKKTDKYASQYAHNEALMPIRTAETVFTLLNSSALNTARFVSSYLNETQPTLSYFENMVAPFLFLVFKTLPLAQITYLGSEGLFFSYYTEGNQILAMYSNTSNIAHVASTRNASLVYDCYTQPADSCTGRRYGYVNNSRSMISINSSWFQEVLNSTTGQVSFGAGWGETHDQLILNTAATIGGGLVSLGFPVKAFINTILTEEASYLATGDGPLGIMPSKDRVPTLFDYSGSDLEKQTDVISCNSTTLRNVILKMGGTSYNIHCASVEIAGVKSVSSLVVPQKGLTRLIDEHSKLVFTLLLLMFTSVTLYTSFVTFLYRRANKRAVFLRATLLKQFEATQEAERKSVNKSLAFASASHDVRSSLAALDGLISLCSAEVAPNSEIYTNLEQMRELASDLLGILNSILDTSKIEAGKMQLSEEEFDLAQVLEDVVNLYYPTGKAKGIDIVLDPCDGSLLECSLVKGDRGKLKQILNNLIHNAIKFTSEGHISVRAWLKKPSLENSILVPDKVGFQNCLSWFFCKKSEAQRDLSTIHAVQKHQNSVELVIEVDDTGKGIPKEKQKSIFENFVQVKETSLEKGGTGLGLGIVRLLVRLMGGDISVVDKELSEKGSCFRFNIFLSRSEEASVTVAAETDLPSDHIPSKFHQNLQLNIMNQNPRWARSCVVLFIHGDERRRTIQKFMESLGINTVTLDREERLFPTLEKIKYRQDLTHPSSSRKYEFGSLNFTSLDFSGGTKDWAMDVEVGTDHTLALQRKGKSTSRFILIVIDLSAANFDDDNFFEVCSMLAEFRKDLHDSQCKVVWLYTPNPSFESRRRDEEKLAHCEHIITKPFHGFKLYQVLRFLPEFGGASTIQHYRSKPTRNMEQLPTDAAPSTQLIGVRSDAGTLKSCQPHDHQQGALSHEKPLHGKKILVVEDQPVLRKVANRILDQLGASTELCENGEEALKLVCKALKETYKSREGSSMFLPYDYILMDCQMPIMNGYEATKRIRMEERLYDIHIPIIALTAHAQDEEHADGVVAGMDYHLTKPLAIEKLLKAISFLDSNGNM